MKNNQYRRIIIDLFVQIPLAMRLLVMLSFIVCFSLSAENTFAQNATVSVGTNSQTIASVLESIEQQTEYTFVYDNKVVDTNKTVSVNINKQSVSTALNTLFQDSDIAYSVINDKIVLNKKEEVSAPQQQNSVIRGVVLDDLGDPLVGVSVLIKGTSTGTVTNIDGEYSITYTDKNAVLVFSYIGFASREEKIGTQKVLDVVLEENIREMDEVVVIGYGTVKKANLSGAISTTDSKAFESRPIQNAATALQGEMPGLTVIRTSGEPGSNPTVRVRDISSINGGSPLILIDGAEGDLNMVNPADIENISVLKDGTAAIYGARAADGVVLITTKSAGRNQKLKVTLDAYYSVKKPALLKKTANLYQHASMGLEITDGSFAPEYTADELSLIAQNSDLIVPNGLWGEYPKFYRDQNWRDMVIGDGSIQNYNLSLSGGGNKHTYLVSLGYQNEKGLPKFGTDSNKRYFVRAKSNIEIVKGLDYDLNLSYEATERNYSSALDGNIQQSFWDLTYKARTWAPMYNPDGTFYTFQGFNNPAQALEQGGVSKGTTGNFTVNNALTWKIVDGLSLVGRAVIRKYDGDKNIINKTFVNYNWANEEVRTVEGPNFAERSYNKTLSKNFTLYGEYKKTFKELHDFGLMIGGAHESANYDNFSARRQNFTQQESMSLPLGSSENQRALSDGNAWTINSAFGRLNYAFAGKYLVEATLRADGSSRFHPDHRWGYFPGVSGAWRLSEEAFMKKFDIFDNLKLRASYGEMGNQSGIGLYDYIQLVSISESYYPFGDGNKAQMASAGNIVSTSRTWETIRSTDVGIDFNMLQNRLFGSFDYFWKSNNNMLIPVTYPSMLGASAPSTNNGKLKIEGWEVSLGWRDQVGGLTYSVKGSLSDAKNKVVEKGGSNNFNLGLNRTRKGFPMDSFFGYAFDGIIQNEQELAEYKNRFADGGIPGDLAVGDAKYKDLDGDGKLSIYGDGSDGAGDAIYLGNTNPRYTFGLNLNAEFKGFDLGAFFQGVGSRTMFLQGLAGKAFPASWAQSAEYWYGKTWTPERTDAKYPALTLNSKSDYNYTTSSNTKHNVAYMRLKNLQFGYTIPTKYVQKLKLEKIRVFFSGEDLFEIHNTPGGWDPEDGGDIVSYPFARNYSFGASLVF